MVGNTGEHVSSFGYVDIDAQADVLAFDNLPPLTRQALSQCAFRINCGSIYEGLKIGMQRAPIELVDKALAQIIRQQDAGMIATAYRERGIEP